jgi:pimeloyl-[acyl-carrier protein] synthase
VPSAVEELLRYDTPSHWALPRTATEDIELPDGAVVPEGAMVILAINAANRDSSVFEDADKLDIEREPNKHIGFAAGPHFCLGATLARQEARTMFHAIATRLPELELVVEPTWKNAYVRSVTALEVRTAR